MPETVAGPVQAERPLADRALVDHTTQVHPEATSGAVSTVPARGLVGTLTRVVKALYPVLRVLVIVAIAVGIVWTTVNQWPSVRDTITGLAWQSIVLSLVMAVLGIFAGMMAWRSSLRDLGHEVPVLTAGRINLIGSLGKYVPGSVWAYVLQMELGRRAGLPRPRAFLASLVSTGLGITSGLAVGLLAVPALTANNPDADAARAALWLLVGLVPVALLCAVPPVLTRLVNLFLKLVRRPQLDHSLTWRGVIRTMAWSVVAYSCFGVHLWLLANAQAEPGVWAVLRSIGAIALALSISVFAFIVPSGIGVREAILVAALAPYLGGNTGVALGITYASRMIFTAADVIAAGAAALSARRELRAVKAAEPVGDVADVPLNGRTTPHTGTSRPEQPDPVVDLP